MNVKYLVGRDDRLISTPHKRLSKSCPQYEDLQM